MWFIFIIKAICFITNNEKFNTIYNINKFEFILIKKFINLRAFIKKISMALRRK